MLSHFPKDDVYFNQLGWLEARHHFSFGNYHDPEKVNIKSLCVWNDDLIKPQTGFGAHSHSNMEIVTYVRKGAISHKDSDGNEGKTSAGNLQVMSAGEIVTHSEQNLEDEECQLFQIWFHPRTPGGVPRWESLEFPTLDKNKFHTIASGYAEDEGAAFINSDSKLIVGTFDKETSTTLHVKENEELYGVPTEGKLFLEDLTINSLDGFHVKDRTKIDFSFSEKTELVIAIMR